YMDDLRALLPGFDHEAEPDRVRLGHVGAHNEHAVAMLEVLLEGGGGSASEGGAQTGHRSAVSYAGLVLDSHDPQVVEQLLDEVVLLVVQRGPAQVGHGEGVVKDVSLVVPLHKGGFTGVPDQLRDALH